MKKSKIVFLCIAAVLAVICLISYTAMQSEPGSSEPKETTVSNMEDPNFTCTSVTTSQNQQAPTFTGDNGQEVDLTAFEYTVRPGVTAKTLVNNYSGPVDMTYIFTPDHPEYCVADLPGNPIGCSDGSIFRNNTELTLSLVDPMFEQTGDIELTFGHITGGLNRWLYLDPKATWDGRTIPFYYKVCSVSYGSVLTITEMESTNKTPKTFSRTHDVTENAQYYDAYNPGLVWFASSAKERVVDIDMIVYTAQGDFLTVVRLQITKGQDGTYSLSSVKDLNLNHMLYMEFANEDEAMMYQDPYYFTADELQYIMEMATTTLNNSDLTKYLIKNGNGDSYTPNPERFVIDYRGMNGMYYAAIVPDESGDPYQSALYLQMGIPMLAVTIRACPTSPLAFTLYYYVIAPASNAGHGQYQYIGRDYYWVLDALSLKGHRYPGDDLIMPK